jgi:hypothetical protein
MTASVTKQVSWRRKVINLAHFYCDAVLLELNIGVSDSVMYMNTLRLSDHEFRLVFHFAQVYKRTKR